MRFSVGTVAAFAESGTETETAPKPFVIKTGPDDDHIEAFSDPAAPDQLRKNVIRCGAGHDTVLADPIDKVAASCENVTRYDPSDPVFQAQAFHCNLSLQRLHKSNGRMVGKSRFECRTGLNELYMAGAMYKWTFAGWDLQHPIKENRSVQTRKAANLNHRINCQSNDDFWWMNQVSSRAYREKTGNTSRYYKTKVSDRKWRC
ncbi:hypothetical protein BH23ACT11_BH23ACT11_09420 [soil metagenome]